MLIWTNASRPPAQRFIFVDRDGVLNIDQPEYIKHWGEFHFYPDTLEALNRLTAHGVGVILISNQSALHRGLMTWDDFWEIHQRMLQQIRAAGGDLLAAFYCPHRPDEECCCRKPSPAMILTAARLFQVSLHDTHFIGDRQTDLLAAERAGCKGILLERPTTCATVSRNVQFEEAGVRCRSLLEAVLKLPGPSAAPSPGQCVAPQRHSI